MGKYWRQMTDEQKDRYSDVFVRYGNNLHSKATRAEDLKI